MFGIKTAADAREMYEERRTALASAAAPLAASRIDAKRLADLVNEVALWEGVVSAFGIWESSCEHLAAHAKEEGLDSAGVLFAKYQLLADMALRDPDDTWSGRSNDTRRSFADGRRQALRRIADLLESASDDLVKQS